MRHPVDVVRSGYLYHRICPDNTPRREADGKLYRGVANDAWRSDALCSNATAAAVSHAELRRRWGSQHDKHAVAVALGLEAEECAPFCSLLAQASPKQGTVAMSKTTARPRAALFVDKGTM